jgi:hypothetical protein
MAQESNGQLRASWRNRIERQRRSGQTIAQFCQQEGVSTPSYYQWKRKLQDEQPIRQKKATTQRKAKPAKRRQAKAAAPSVSPPFVQLPMPAPRGCPWIEVVLSEGTIVRLPQQNLAALKTVLGALGNHTSPSTVEESHHA